MKFFFISTILFHFFNNSSLLEEVTEIKFTPIKITKNNPNTPTYYVHKKFCKILNFKLNKKEEGNRSIIKILLFDDGNKDFLLKEHDRPLNSSSEFNLYIRNNLQKEVPITIEQIEPTLEDEIIFGSQYIKFGNLFKITFKAEDRYDNLSLELAQMNKLITVRI